MHIFRLLALTVILYSLIPALSMALPSEQTETARLSSRSISEEQIGTLDESNKPRKPSISFTKVPSIGSSKDLKGIVANVKANNYRVVVYIYAGSGWWVKPYYNKPLTKISSKGSWSTDITTGGVDSSATYINAYLIPKSYSPPRLMGSASIPEEVIINSVAQVSVKRSS